MSHALSAAQRRYVRTETIVSIVLNAAVSALFVWIVFRGQDVIPLWGAQGLVVDLIPTCFAITLMSTIAMTLLTRVRLKRNRVERVSTTTGIARFLPRALPLRAFAFALAVTVIAVPLSAAALALVGFDGRAYNTVLAFKIAYGAVLAVLISPPILVRALAD